MKLSNAFFYLRNFLIKPSIFKLIADGKYFFSTLADLLRGYIAFFKGRIQYGGPYRDLLLGKNVSFHMEYGSSIILESNDFDKVIDPVNLLYPEAVSLGTLPHWNFMNPVTYPITRIRLRQNAKLIMGINTFISRGCYIAVWPNQLLEIGANTNIAQGVFINTKCGLSIGKNVMIAHEVSIMDYDGHPVFYNSNLIKDSEDTYGGKAKKIIIEDKVWIGFRAIILKGCRIGQGSIVGAGSCVITDVPPNSIVIGNPAKIIRRGITWEKY